MANVLIVKAAEETANIITELFKSRLKALDLLLSFADDSVSDKFKEFRKLVFSSRDLIRRKTDGCSTKLYTIGEIAERSCTRLPINSVKCIIDNLAELGNCVAGTAKAILDLLDIN